MSNVRAQQKRLPETPALLFIAIAFALAPLGFMGQRLRAKRPISGLQVSVVAIGLALAALMVTVSATYALRPLHAARGSNWLVVVPLLAYFSSSLIIGLKAKIDSGSLGIWVAAGIMPVAFLGFYVWLLAACSFGDCL